MIKSLIDYGKALAQSPAAESLKLTAIINAFSAIKIPLLGFVTPQVVRLTDDTSEVRIRLDRRTRNHLGAMYFGALAMGAELSIALKAVVAIENSGKKIDFIFKDFSSEFLRRVDGHAHFVCEEADQVELLIKDSAQTDQRLEKKFKGYAYVPSSSSDPVMTYNLTLSVKNRTP